MKRIMFLFLIMSCTLGACGPSNSEIQATVQASVAQTQTAIPTVNPCSDRGWADIAIYLHQFDQEVDSAQEGTNKLAFIQQLENTKDKINAVSIDACTEHARQLVVAGLANEIYCFQLALAGGAKKDYEDVGVKGAYMILDAKNELDGLGIYLNYP